jgi:hypothetical protein
MESDTPLKNTMHEIENRVSKYKWLYELS